VTPDVRFCHAGRAYRALPDPLPDLRGLILRGEKEEEGGREWIREGEGKEKGKNGKRRVEGERGREGPVKNTKHSTRKVASPPLD